MSGSTFSPTEPPAPTPVIRPGCGSSKPESSFSPHRGHFVKRHLIVAAVSLALAGLVPAAQAHSRLSDASALSMLPVAVSVAAPAALGASVLVGGSTLTVLAVETVSGATVWVLERASDGLRISITLAGASVAGVSVAAGTAVVVTAFSAGWVLSAAGQAIAYVPNEIGRALLHNERVTR